MIKCFAIQTSDRMTCRCGNAWGVSDPVPPCRLAQDAADLLEKMAATFRERNAVYKDNHRQVGDVMAILFPQGIELHDAEDFDIWHLFELIIVKLTRFSNSGLEHRDSIHDIAVYAAMVESLIIEQENRHERHSGDGK